MECRISIFLDGETVLYYVYFLFMKISETFAIKTMTMQNCYLLCVQYQVIIDSKWKSEVENR